MNSIRLGAVAAVFVAGQALAQNSQISYELELNGDNHAADWKNPPGCAGPTPFTPGVTTDGLVFPANSKITWAARAAVSGTHSDGFVPSGIANTVFSLELRKDGELVAGFGKGDNGTTPGFYSTINDGTARGCLAPSDPVEAAAFTVSYQVDPDNYPIYGRLIDAPTGGGPLLDYFQYPSVEGYPAGSTAASGTLQGVGAGYSKYVSYGCPVDCGGGLGFNVAGVGRDAAAVGGCGSKLGTGAIVEGQLNLTGLPGGTYTLTLIPGTGNNILSGNFNCGFGDPGKFAAKPDLPTLGDTITFVIEGGAQECERTVVGRHLFYNNSFYDSAQAACTTMNGGTPCSDNSAIAPDRVALLPGQSPLVPSPDSTHPAGPVANYSSYLLGINGIMIDIQHGEGCAPLPANLSPADIASTFEFVEGGRAVNNPYTGNVRVPTSVTVAPHPTLPNTDRVTIIFADDTSTNGRWLRCRLLPTGVIGGLAAEDRFYFGLAKAEGLSIQSGAPLTNTTDVNDAKADPHTTFTRAPITCRNDFNKDSVVNTTDQNLAKSWVTTTFTSLQLTGVAP